MNGICRLGAGELSLWLRLFRVSGLEARRLLHHHIGVHHNETPVGVIDEPSLSEFSAKGHHPGSAGLAIPPAKL